MAQKIASIDSALTQSAGTFSPELAGSTDAGTWEYTTQSGYYVRHGNMCFVSIRINPSSIADSPTGSLIITGLPYTAVAGANQVLPVMATGINWTASAVQLQIYIAASGTEATFYGTLNNGTWAAVPVGNIVATDDLIISGWYQITP
jgi:hypothetical protein